MKEIYVTVEDLEKMVEYAKLLQPTQGDAILIKSESHGMGSSLFMTVRKVVNGVNGDFTIDLTDVSKW